MNPISTVVRQGFYSARAREHRTCYGRYAFDMLVAGTLYRCRSLPNLLRVLDEKHRQPFDRAIRHVQFSVALRMLASNMNPKLTPSLDADFLEKRAEVAFNHQ